MAGPLPLSKAGGWQRRVRRWIRFCLAVVVILAGMADAAAADEEESPRAIGLAAMALGVTLDL